MLGLTKRTDRDICCHGSAEVEFVGQCIMGLIIKAQNDQRHVDVGRTHQVALQIAIATFSTVIVKSKILPNPGKAKAKVRNKKEKRLEVQLGQSTKHAIVIGVVIIGV